MIRHLLIVNYFSFGIESLWTRRFTVIWDFIEIDNSDILTLKVKGFIHKIM